MGTPSTRIELNHVFSTDKVVEKGEIYSLRKALLRFNLRAIRNAFAQINNESTRLHYFITESGNKYKCMQIKKSKVKDQKAKELLRYRRRCLEKYQGLEIVPDLFYADEKTLIVEWLNGTQLHQLCLKESPLLEEFIEFYLKSFLPHKTIPLRDYHRHTISRLEELAEKGILSPGLYQSVNKCYSQRVKLPEEITYSLCLGDNSLKNFILMENQKFRYIDIDGIGHAIQGEILGKFILALPTPIKDPCWKMIQAKSTFGEYIPFYILTSCISTIWAKSYKAFSKKRTFFNRRRFRKRYLKTISQLEKLVSAFQQRKNLADVLSTLS
jgi:hypothetical protein